MAQTTYIICVCGWVSADKPWGTQVRVPRHARPFEIRITSIVIGRLTAQPFWIGTAGRGWFGVDAR